MNGVCLFENVVCNGDGLSVIIFNQMKRKIEKILKTFVMHKVYETTYKTAF